MPRDNRLNIVIAGRMNAGKSTFTNTLTQNNSSIVDATPGTTADAKISLMEIHGLGACKIFDTAGLDETGELGAKKRKKTLKIIDQADVVCIIQNKDLGPVGFYDSLIKEYAHYISGNNKMIGYDTLLQSALFSSQTNRQIMKRCQQKKKPFIVVRNNTKAHTGKITCLQGNTIGVNLVKADAHELAGHIKRVLDHKQVTGSDILPKFIVDTKAPVLLIIPLDAQSPKLRLLRPQQQAIEALLSNKSTVVCYHLDLQRARAVGTSQAELDKIRKIVSGNGIRLVITDSQAIDVVKEIAGESKITTFSVMQQHLLLGRDLFAYVSASTHTLDGIVKQQPKQLRILISEACQHDRITEHCEDIGTKQIPRKLAALLPNTELNITFSLGKDDELMDQEFDLVIHCGGCMISGQQMRSRVGGFRDRGVPVVSYGTFLSYAAGGTSVVDRVEEVWR